MTINPKNIFKGATLGLLCPAGGFDDYKPIQNVVKYLHSLGFNVKLGKSLLKSNSLFQYLSGPDDSRISDFNDFILDDDIDAIFCLRGGYGTLRILDSINYSAIKKKRKIILGYSDITSLLLAISHKTNLLVFHSPMLGKSISSRSLSAMWNHLHSSKFSFNYKTSKTINSGKASGTLLGGNLSVLVSMIGSKYLPSFKNSILFLEDCNEPLYKIDRFLTQLKLSGILKDISGLVFGEFTNCGLKSPSDYRMFYKNKFSSCNIPIVYNFPVGHGKTNLILPIGQQVILDTKNRVLKSK